MKRSEVAAIQNSRRFEGSEFIYRVASLLVIALTLVPALAAKVRVTRPSRLRVSMDAAMYWLQDKYAQLLKPVLHHRLIVSLLFIAGLLFSVPTFFSGRSC